MAGDIMWVGLDAHKKFISVAVLYTDHTKALELQVANSVSDVRKLAKKLKRRASGEIRACYEAGPTGYGLQRTLEAEGIVCEVVAPSLIPVKAGDRIKTDRRDAKKLAELLRADLLTEVRAPTPEEESIRDLCRCREDAKEDQKRAQHRLEKFLLRRSLIYTGGKQWTHKHFNWISEIRFDNDADTTVFADYRHAVELVIERIKTLDAKIELLSSKAPFSRPVGWLRCYSGIDTLTAMMLVAELHDIRRFESPRKLMAYVGLVPSEHSSGGKTVRGGITKTGNGHARRILIEAVQHYRHAPRLGARVRKRREGQPAEAVSIAERAHLRLNRRYMRFIMNGMPHNKAKTAVARELVGFVWASLNACTRGTKVVGSGPTNSGTSGIRQRPSKQDTKRKAA